MKAVKFYRNIMVSARWLKKGNWFVLPTIAILKEGILFAWMRLVLKIVRIKLIELEKGGSQC